MRDEVKSLMDDVVRDASLRMIRECKKRMLDALKEICRMEERLEKEQQAAAAGRASSPRHE